MYIGPIRESNTDRLVSEFLMGLIIIITILGAGWIIFGA
jgi:hypothetical protein